MGITTNQSIAGFPALQVREFVRKYRFTNFPARAAEATLMLSTEASANFLSKLVDLGFIGKSRERDGVQLFQLTSSGQALANASAAKPIYRKTAERILAQFLERVHTVNANPAYLFRVKNVGRAVLRRRTEPRSDPVLKRGLFLAVNQGALRSLLRNAGVLFKRALPSGSVLCFWGLDWIRLG